MLMQKGQNSLNGLKYDTFIGHFPSDGMARMAVKGLNDFFLISVSLSGPHLHEDIWDPFSPAES